MINNHWLLKHQSFNIINSFLLWVPQVHCISNGLRVHRCSVYVLVFEFIIYSQQRLFLEQLHLGSWSLRLSCINNNKSNNHNDSNNQDDNPNNHLSFLYCFINNVHLNSKCEISIRIASYYRYVLGLCNVDNL